MRPRDPPPVPDPAARSALRPAATAVPSSWDLARASALAGIAVAAFVALLALAWFGSDVLLLVFAGILFGLLLDGLVRGLGTLLPRWLRLSAVLLTLGGLAYGASLQGVEFGRQASALGPTIARQADLLREELARRGLQTGSPRDAQGEGAPRPNGAVDSPADDSGAEFVAPPFLAGAGPVIERLAALITDLVGALGPLLVIILLSLAVALDPRAYRDGTLRLTPPRQRWRVAQALDRSGEELRRWLLVRLVAMLATGLGTWAGLRYLGTAAPLVLGLQAGLLAFVPVLGPIVAGFVILLASLASGAQAALSALAVFAGVLLVVGTLLKAIVRGRAPVLPPGATLAGQVVLGMLLGLPGLVLAVPLMLVGRVVLERIVADMERQAQAREA